MNHPLIQQNADGFAVKIPTIVCGSNLGIIGFKERYGTLMRYCQWLEYLLDESRITKAQYRKKLNDYHKNFC